MMPATANRDDWATPLAALVASIRRDWDLPGIRAMIHKARHLGTPLEVAMALLRLAERTELTTPAMLAHDGAHWGTATTVPTARQPRCAVEGHEYELAASCRICATDGIPGDVPEGVTTLPPEQIERNARGAHLVRQALRQHTTTPTTRQPDVRELAAGEREDDR